MSGNKSVFTKLPTKHRFGLANLYSPFPRQLTKHPLKVFFVFRKTLLCYSLPRTILRRRSPHVAPKEQKEEEDDEVTMVKEYTDEGIEEREIRVSNDEERGEAVS